MTESTPSQRYAQMARGMAAVDRAIAEQLTAYQAAWQQLVRASNADDTTPDQFFEICDRAEAHWARVVLARDRRWRLQREMDALKCN